MVGLANAARNFLGHVSLIQTTSALAEKRKGSPKPPISDTRTKNDVLIVCSTLDELVDQVALLKSHVNLPYNVDGSALHAEPTTNCNMPDIQPCSSTIAAAPQSFTVDILNQTTRACPDSLSDRIATAEPGRETSTISRNESIEAEERQSLSASNARTIDFITITPAEILHFFDV